jgi:hypothetical protein
MGNHVKIPVVISVLLLMSVRGGAQQAPGVDVLPLAVGATWDYTFYRSYYVIGWGGETDTGIVRYAVAGREVFADSTIWHMTRLRSYTHTSYYKSGGTMTSYPVDSMRFELVELHGGLHEVYRPQFDSLDLFSLLWTGVDSLRFYRYDGPGLSYPRIEAFNYRPWTALNPSLEYQFSVDGSSGILGSSGQISVAWNAAHTTRYHLTGYFKPFAGPHLTYSAPVSFSAFTGVSVDTSFIVANDGGDTLHLQSVQCRDAGFTAFPTSTTIPPLGQASILIHCASPPDGMTQTALIVKSNSIYAPDTIPVVMRSTYSRSLTLESRAVDFGMVARSARHVDTTVALMNTGNLPVTIDSITVTAAQFAWADYGYGFTVKWGIDRTALNPAETATFTMRMDVNPRLEKESLDVRIYSSAPSSPDRIHMQFATYGATVIITPRTVDFGVVGVGGRSDAIVWLTAVGEAGVSVTRGQPSDNAFTCPYPISFVDFYQTVADTIRFSPHAVLNFREYVVYASHGTYGQDALVALDTVWLKGRAPGADTADPSSTHPTEYVLEQNYPNPFNPATVIRCGVPRSGDVRLVIYDLLGREAVVLHDGMLEAGTYEFRFSAAGYSSGSYICRMQAGDVVRVIRMVLVR